MMLSNFLFENSVGILFGGRHYDLHSFFFIKSVVIHNGSGLVDIELRTLDEHREQAHGILGLRLTFTEVTYLEVSAGICQAGSLGLEEFGFKSPEDRDDQWLKRVEDAEPGDHFFIRIDGNEFIRIASKAVVAKF